MGLGTDKSEISQAAELGEMSSLGLWLCWEHLSWQGQVRLKIRLNFSFFQLLGWD